MNNLYDVLEKCLQELENGQDLETVLARYPDLAAELRPILKASVKARMRSISVSAPSKEVVRRGRAKLLQHASEMRERKVTPRKRMIPIFQRLAITFTLTSLFLASGTGLVSASSSALPGENLYPVKRTWEDVRLFFVFDQQAHTALKNEFENERLQEVSDLLVEGRDEIIQFAGVFRQLNGVMYVSGVTVLIPVNLQIPADGAAVVVTGQTNSQGFVEIKSIELLPDGAIVPTGEPVEKDGESGLNPGVESGLINGAVPSAGLDSEQGTGSGSGSGNQAQGSDANAAPQTDPQTFEAKGTLESINSNNFILNSQTYTFDKAKIDGVLKPGVNVEIKGYYAADGSFVVTEVKVTNSGSAGDGNENSSSNSGSNLNDNSGSTNNNDYRGPGGGSDGDGDG